MGIIHALDDLTLQPFLQMRRSRLQLRHAVNHVNRQIVPVDLIQDRQLQWCIDIAHLLIAAHVNIVVVLPPVRKLVNERSIRMKIKYHRPIQRKQAIELPL